MARPRFVCLLADVGAAPASAHLPWEPVVLQAAPTLRPDFEATKRRQCDLRSPERIVRHYQLERRLAEKLRGAPAPLRAGVYAEVYAELFAALPDHPQRASSEQKGHAMREAGILTPYLRRGTTYLELGCGDATVSFSVANRVAFAFGLDVTDLLIDYERAPTNFRFVPTGGVDIPLQSSVVDLAYSNHLMEYLHPEDAEAQLREVHRVLKPGARYVCLTSSRLTGPHDVSVYFDYEARGFHLREYDYRSLRELGLAAGFHKVDFYCLLKGRRLPAPFLIGAALERLLDAAPPPARASATKLKPVRLAMGVNAVMRR